MTGKTITDIIDNVKNVSMSEHAMAAMLEFERVIDELDVYAFKNWMDGELVEGPQIEKHFVTATFMWPYRMMPDPRGGEQLLNYNCVVTYEKSHLVFPIKVKGYEDFEAGSKMPKKAKTPIWLVSITMPRALMDEFKESMEEMVASDIETEESEDLLDVEAVPMDGGEDENTEVSAMAQQGVGI